MISWKTFWTYLLDIGHCRSKYESSVICVLHFYSLGFISLSALLMPIKLIFISLTQFILCIKFTSFLSLMLRCLSTYFSIVCIWILLLGLSVVRYWALQSPLWSFIIILLSCSLFSHWYHAPSKSHRFCFSEKFRGNLMGCLHCIHLATTSY